MPFKTALKQGFQVGQKLGWPLGRSDSSGAFVFTDDLIDGAGTPVAITTSIATRQCWQKGAAISLAGTYDLDGGSPTYFAARVGSGSWVLLQNQSVGGGSWSGDFVYDEYAQGTLQIKPINGENVTPAQVLNITVSDIFAVCGQSNAEGRGTSAQTYTKTNYDFVVYEDGTWSSRTTADWAAVAADGSCWPQFAMMLDQAGIPPVIVRGHTASGTGFGNNDWNQGDVSYEAAEADMDAAAPGGWKAILWFQGEKDAIDGTGEAVYEASLAAMLDALQSDVTDFSNVPLFAVVFGEVSGATDGNIENIRNAVIDLGSGDADVRRGPSLLHYDLSDNLHLTTNAQLTDVGKQWWRCVNAIFYGAGDGALPPQVLSATPGDGANKDQITIVFDRAMQNHADTTGWAVSDGGGTVSISSGAAGTTTVTNDTVVLTLARDLYGSVALSFGRGTDAVGATLADDGSDVDLPPDYLESFDAGTGNGVEPDYAANAVEFDGTADWLSNTSISPAISDGNYGTISVWIYIDTWNTGGNSIIFGAWESSAMRIGLFTTSTSGQLRVLGRDAAGTTELDYTFNSAVAEDTWTHVIVSWDMTTADDIVLYANGSLISGTKSIFNQNQSLGYGDSDEITIGSNADGAAKFAGYMADLWVSLTEHVDLSDNAVRAKFYSGTGKPVNLGADGSTPTGSQPEFFHANATATWENNLGSNSDFTENGALTTAPSSPSD